MEACGKDFMLFSGIELLCYPMLAIGGTGSISVTANVAPALVAEMHDNWFNNDKEGALNLHYKLMRLNDVLFRDTNPAPSKAALGMMGKIHPKLRLPMDVPEESLQATIKETLEEYKLILFRTR